MPFQIKQEKFEGPLELLLELIGKEKLSISEVSLAKIADEYIGYVKSLDKIDPESLAEFLVVAAQLMLIKSRSLLPTLQLREEEEISIEELQKRLAEYQQIRGCASKIREQEQMRRYIFTREAYMGVDPVFYPPPGLTVRIFADTFAAFLAALPKIEKLVEEKIRHIVSLEEKIVHIRSFLKDVLEETFSELVRGTKDKIEIIVSFLAILELARQKFITPHQRRLFEDIVVKRVNE